MFRRIIKYLLTIVALAAGASTVCQAQTLMTRHVREVTQNGQAHFVGPLSGAQTMRVVLILPLRDPAGLDNFIQELYDPTSPNYRQFLSVQEFTSMFGPAQQDYDAVIKFAESNGLKVAATSPNRVNLDVVGTVAAINKALHITLGVYQHPTEDRTFYAPDREPTTDLPFQLWHVAGLDNYSIPHPAGLHKGVKPQCDHRFRTLGLIPRQRHARRLLRRLSHWQRPVARLARILRHRFVRSRYLL